MKIPLEIRRGRVTGHGVSLEADSKEGAAMLQSYRCGVLRAAAKLHRLVC